MAKNKNKWLYGETLLKQGDLKSLDDWSDQKEYVYQIMDEEFDYLWDEDENGIHFVDRVRGTGDYIPDDELGNQREADGTLELHFNNLDEVEKWIKEHDNYL